MLIRSRLEGLAAKRATTRVTMGQLRDLDVIMDQLDLIRGSLSSPAGSRRLADQRQWSRKNEEFHDLLVEIAECPPLGITISTIVRAYPRDVTWLTVERYPSALAEYSDDHRGIHEALRRCDPDLAQTRAREHVERTLGYLRLVFELDDSHDRGAPV